MNKICITGRAVDRTELKSTQNGVSVCRITLAVKRPYTKDVTDFIECVAFRGQAEYLYKYTDKGDLIAVTGTLTSSKYESKDGKKLTAWAVQVDTVERLSQKNNTNSGGNDNADQTDGIGDMFSDVKDVSDNLQDELPF